MARVTVEDCLKYVDNRFELVALGAQRARDLIAGAEPVIQADNNPVVLSLREIGSGKLDIDQLRLSLTKSLRIAKGIVDTTEVQPTSEMLDLDALFADLDTKNGTSSTPSSEIDGSIFSNVTPNEEE